MPKSERKITRADIIPIDQYNKERKERRAALLPIKKARRLEVGPHVTFHFENYDTMWLQVHEMLLIEKGGEPQIADELAAYNPLIPQGSELVATMMVEIEDPVRRAQILAQLGHIEDHVILDLAGEKIKAVPSDDAERTTEAGKTSSVHFIHFPLTKAQVAKFRDASAQAILGIAHENYSHMAGIPAAVRAELAKDFA
jgi:hypothetical protein